MPLEPRDHAKSATAPRREGPSARPATRVRPRAGRSRPGEIPSRRPGPQPKRSNRKPPARKRKAHRERDPAIRPLNRDLERLIRKRKGGSFKTREERRSILMLAANQLHEGGFGLMRARNLAGRHVGYLVLRWRDETARKTVRNRLVHLRWWARTISKAGLVPKDELLGVADRSEQSDCIFRRSPYARLLRKVSDPHVRMSLRLQEEFGLTRREAIRFAPLRAENGRRRPGGAVGETARAPRHPDPLPVAAAGSAPRRAAAGRRGADDPGRAHAERADQGLRGRVRGGGDPSGARAARRLPVAAVRGHHGPAMPGAGRTGRQFAGAGGAPRGLGRKEADRRRDGLRERGGGGALPGRRAVETPPDAHAVIDRARRRTSSAPRVQGRPDDATDLRIVVAPARDASSALSKRFFASTAHSRVGVAIDLPKRQRPSGWPAPAEPSNPDDGNRLHLCRTTTGAPGVTDVHTPRGAGAMSSPLRRENRVARDRRPAVDGVARRVLAALLPGDPQPRPDPQLSGPRSRFRLRCRRDPPDGVPNVGSFQLPEMCSVQLRPTPNTTGPASRPRADRRPCRYLCLAL